MSSPGGGSGGRLARSGSVTFTADRGNGKKNFEKEANYACEITYHSKLYFGEETHDNVNQTAECSVNCHHKPATLGGR